MYTKNHQRSREKYFWLHFLCFKDNSQTLPIADRIMLSPLPCFRFYRKLQLCKGLGKIRSCFFICFKYVGHFYNYQSKCTFIYPLSNLNCCVSELFLILSTKQNSADNANIEIEAYTDLGPAFQRVQHPNWGQISKDLWSYSATK